MNTTMLGATTEVTPDAHIVTVHYRVRRLSIRSDASEWTFASEADAREHHQRLVDDDHDALIILERVETVGADGQRPVHNEVTSVARAQC